MQLLKEALIGLKTSISLYSKDIDPESMPFQDLDIIKSKYLVCKAYIDMLKCLNLYTVAMLEVEESISVVINKFSPHW